MYPDEGQSEYCPNGLHRAGEDYLKTVLLLQKANCGVRSSDIAKELKVSKASVCNAIKRQPLEAAACDGNAVSNFRCPF